jgi:hypothetical protein
MSPSKAFRGTPHAPAHHRPGQHVRSPRKPEEPECRIPSPQPHPPLPNSPATQGFPGTAPAQDSGTMLDVPLDTLHDSSFQVKRYDDARLRDLARSSGNRDSSGRRGCGASGTATS